MSNCNNKTYIIQPIATLGDDTYLTGGTFNTSTGDLDLNKQSGSTVTVNLDGRYLTGSTDTYLTGTTLDGSILHYDMADNPSAFTTNFSGLTVNGDGGGALTFSPTGNTSGIIISGRTEANYGDVGVRAKDFSYSSSASSTRGATGEDSMAWGKNTTASSLYATASGYGTTASAEYAMAWGYQTQATDYGATAWGRNTTASNDYSTAFGYYTTASGRYSTAFGTNSTASGYYSDSKW
jgi:hypothetical protein